MASPGNVKPERQCGVVLHAVVHQQFVRPSVSLSCSVRFSSTAYHGRSNSLSFFYYCFFSCRAPYEGDKHEVNINVCAFAGAFWFDPFFFQFHSWMLFFSCFISSWPCTQEVSVFSYCCYYWIQAISFVDILGTVIVKWRVSLTSVVFASDIEKVPLL